MRLLPAAGSREFSLDTQRSRPPESKCGLRRPDDKSGERRGRGNVGSSCSIRGGHCQRAPRRVGAVVCCAR